MPSTEAVTVSARTGIWPDEDWSADPIAARNGVAAAPVATSVERLRPGIGVDRDAELLAISRCRPRDQRRQAAQPVSRELRRAAVGIEQRHVAARSRIRCRTGRRPQSQCRSHMARASAARIRLGLVGSQQEIVPVGVRFYDSMTGRSGVRGSCIASYSCGPTRDWQLASRNLKRVEHVGETSREPKVGSSDVKPKSSAASARQPPIVYRAPRRPTLRDSVPGGGSPARVLHTAVDLAHDFRRA